MHPTNYCGLLHHGNKQEFGIGDGCLYNLKPEQVKQVHHFQFQMSASAYYTLLTTTGLGICYS